MYEDKFQDAKKYFMQGVFYLENKEYQNALDFFERSLAIIPGRLSTLINYSATLIKLNKLDLAMQYCQQIIQLDKNAAENYLNIAEINLKNLDYIKAIENNTKAIALNNNYAEAYFNLAGVYRRIKNFEISLKNYEKAIEYKNDYFEALFNKSILLLENNYFDEGWKFYENRWKTDKFKNAYLKTFKPEINTLEKISNKKILIWSEQGVGDEILYFRLISDLLKICEVKNIILMTNKKLIELFKRSIPEINYIESTKDLENIFYDMHIPFASLGKLFRKDISNFKNNTNSYLKADKNKSANIKNLLNLNDKKYVCGLSWKSNNSEYGYSKSMNLKNLLPILNLKNIEFINLQYGDVTKELLEINSTDGIEIKNCDEIDNFEDIDGLASLIEVCDFVVTVSNTTAHLAGALGKDTFMMMSNGIGSLWYWLNQDTDKKNLWYPSVKIFTQSNPDEWSDVILAIKNKIEKIKQ